MNLTNKLCLGIEIGGTKTQVGIGTREDGLLAGGILRRTVNPGRGADGICRDLLSMVDEALSFQNLTLSDIERIGIGYGGPVDRARGVTLKSFQIDGWTDFPLKDWAEDHWGKPVIVENDASTAGLAEYVHGSGRGCSRLFYITAGSGVGGGWIVDGRIDNGQGLGAAEIGHMWVPDPRTGQLTELEQICSGWAIGERARQAAAISGSLMGELAGSSEKIDAKIVYSAAEQGDEIALCILQETCVTLGAAVANVVALLHPGRIILGGGVSLMGPVFWDLLQKEFRARVMPIFVSQVELVQARLREDVVIIGALCL
ncbi:MAG TPA: ROK family protein [Anaerolineales bacterium]|nr:ROK family protein [Anaerolineales bacterium]